MTAQTENHSVSAEIEKAMDMERNLEGLRRWTDEERTKYAEDLGEVSLFSDKIEEDDELIQAMQALQYEGETPQTLALHFKEKGNEMVADAKKLHKRYWRDALKYYDEAAAWAIKAESMKEEEKDPTIDMRALRAAILSNRAAVNLVFKNYGRVLSDCTQAIHLDPSNVKTFFRAAKALMALKRYDETAAKCRDGLKLDQENKSLKKMLAEATELHEKEKRTKAEKRRNLLRKRAAIDTLKAVCEQRSIRAGPNVFDDERLVEYGGKVAIYEDGSVGWPVFFLYDEYGQSDVVREMSENETLREQLEVMFPEGGVSCEWDARGDYRVSNLVVLMEAEIVPAFASDKEWYRNFDCTLDGEDEEDSTEAARREAVASLNEAKAKYWLEISLDCTLLQVLQHKRVVLPGVVPIFNVLVRGTEAHEKFQRMYKGRILSLQPSTQHSPQRSKSSKSGGFSDQIVRTCGGPCGKVEVHKGEFAQCARCQSVAYCSRECQRASWKMHKKECLPIGK